MKKVLFLICVAAILWCVVSRLEGTSVFRSDTDSQNVASKDKSDILMDADILATNTEAIASAQETSGPIDITPTKVEGKVIEAANEVPDAGPVAGTEDRVAVPADPANNNMTQKAVSKISVKAMEISNDTLLEKLAEYENCCAGVFDWMMVFEYLPMSSAEAVEMAADMAGRLKSFADAGVTPIVALEPVDENYEPLSFGDIAKGKYDAAFSAYFAELKKRGVDDDMMGMWVPIPEPNLDEWGDKNHDPAEFGTAYNKCARLIRNEFPSVKLSILIDNETYNSRIDDTEIVSLVPWVQTADPSLVDSFGLQGYPWSAPYGENYRDYDAGSFLGAARALEAASVLGVRSIWLSTGTFSKMFCGQKGREVIATNEERRLMLNGILEQAKIARSAGYEVMINIFAENKCGTEEATDFSYWSDKGDCGDPMAKIFSEFTASSAREGISMAVYDSVSEAEY